MQNESPYRMIIFNSCMAKKVLTLQNAADGKTVNWIKKKPTNHKKYIPKIWAQSVKRSRSSFPSKFKLIPFIGLGGIVSSRFEFNWRRCLGAVTQKLSNHCTITCVARNTNIFNISAQSFKRLRRLFADKMYDHSVRQSLVTKRFSILKT